jgi:hypothetical protein
MARDHLAQCGGFQYIDLVAPCVETPAHLKDSASLEGYDKGAILCLLRVLIGIEDEAAALEFLARSAI